MVAASEGLSRSLGSQLLAVFSHVTFLNTVETLNVAFVHAAGNQVISLGSRSKVTKGARSRLGIWVVARWWPFSHVLETVILV